MALSEQEEFELLSLERERAMQNRPQPSQADVRRVETGMPPYTAPPFQASPGTSAMQAGLRAAQAGPMAPFVLGGELQSQMGRLTEQGAYAAGGKVTDLTGSPAAGFATNLGIQAAPVVLGGMPAKFAGSPALESAGKWLMQKAVKPSSTVSAGDVDRALTTMLEKGINATPGGMRDIRAKVGKLYDEVSEIIKNSKEGVSADVAKSLQRSLTEFRYSIINREANLSSIAKAEDDWMKAIADLDPMGAEYGRIPVQLAQKIKQATQRHLSDKFGELSSAQYEAGKDIASHLRRGIEGAEPGVISRNAEMEQLLNALSVAERHAAVAGNKNTAGLSLVAENPAAGLAFMADRSELVKSLLARLLYSGRDQIPATAARAGIAGYESATQNRETRR